MKEIIEYLLTFSSHYLKYFIIVGIPFFIFYKLFPNYFSNNKIQKRVAKNKDFIKEIKHSMQSTAIFAVIAIIFTKTTLVNYTQIYLDINTFSIWWIPISVVLALILHDTYFYWMHRTVHHPKLYRTVHLIHHKSINPTPWASHSFHVFEAVAESLIFPLILFVIPMHPIALATFGIAALAINVYGHLGFEIMPKWFRNSFLFQILNSSVYHNLHHKKFNGNYGLYFRFWDRIMKTEQPDYVEEYDKIQEKRFGVNSLKKKEKDKIILVLKNAYRKHNKKIKI